MESPQDEQPANPQEIPQDDLQDELQDEPQVASTLTPAERALFEAARQVLENGMKLLGITPIARRTVAA